MATKKDLLINFIHSSKKLECLKKKEAKLKQIELNKDSFIGKTKDEFKAFVKENTQKVKEYINKNGLADKGEKLADDIKHNYTMFLERGHKAHKMKAWGKHIIYCLTKAEKKTRTEIIEEFHISEDTANKVLSKLKVKGIIDMTEEDNPTISLTTKGKDIASTMDAYLEKLSDNLLANFSDDEINTLDSLLNKFQANLKDKMQDIKNKLAEIEK